MSEETETPKPSDVAGRIDGLVRQEPTKVYWLIEHLERVPRQYLILNRLSALHAVDEWTYDPSKATRFESYNDANLYASHKDELCDAFEHMDCTGPNAPLEGRD